MLGKSELQSLTAKSALGGKLTRGFTMGGFLSKAELESLLAGAVKTTVIGGGAAGNHTVTGIKVGDALRAVLKLDVANAQHGAIAHGAGANPVAHTTAELPALTDHDDNPTYHTAHPAADIVAAVADHAAMTHTRTWSAADLTSEFSIAGDDTINNAGGTETTGAVLVVVYEDLTP